MAKKESKDAYSRLKHILILLLTIAVIAAVCFLLTRSYVDQKVKTRQTEINAQNEELTKQYEQRLAEQTKKEEKGENIQWPEAAKTGWDIIDVSNFALTGTTRKTVSRQEMVAGGLLLVNRWHSLPTDFTEDDLVNISNESKRYIPVDTNTIKLKTDAYNALYEMLQGAEKDGLTNFIISEGYRTNDKQTEYFNSELAKWEGKYTGDALVEKARENANYPGTSEYQTGLSFRIRRWKKDDAEFNSVKFVESEHLNWLLDHSWEYGIVFRFPVEGYPNNTVTDKSWKTGESKKLMIFRYVGKAAAAVMEQKDMCLEEFIEYMIAHPHIAVYQDGTLKYEIIRYEGGNTTADMSVEVVARAKDTQVSIDNMGGVIVAMTYAD